MGTPEWSPRPIQPNGWSFGLEIECNPLRYTHAAIKLLTSFGKVHDGSVLDDRE